MTPSSLGAASKGKVGLPASASRSVEKTSPSSAPATHATVAPASRKTMPVLPTGSLAPEEIYRVVRRNRRAVRFCYERQLIKEPTLHGKVLVNFIIDRDGSVREVRVDDSTLKNVEVEDCLLARIRSWVFPAPRGGIVNVRYPFVFRTQP
ncbi:MAG: energy transducer TonB [Deltaproteobacteria bacterium]|nr:energy transducer TonB [Deltaproteobacteria bacterium]